MIKRILSVVACLLVFSPEAYASDMGRPVVTDSRIKVLVYNENEVFNLTTHYGYQSNIEFGKFEEIETISIGDQVGWQIIPAGRRLFIKALEENAHTNMTVITSKRTYQFDLKARKSPMDRDEELVYVVRFYYPDEAIDAPQPRVHPADLAQMSMPEPAPMPMQMTQGMPQSFNFNYTLTGSEMIAPVKVFDDGVSTYLQFNTGEIPSLFEASTQGGELPLAYRREGEFIVVDRVMAKILVRSGPQLVCVFNEQFKSF